RSRAAVAVGVAGGDVGVGVVDGERDGGGVGAGGAGGGAPGGAAVEAVFAGPGGRQGDDDVAFEVGVGVGEGLVGVGVAAVVGDGGGAVAPGPGHGAGVGADQDRAAQDGGGQLAWFAVDHRDGGDVGEHPPGVGLQGDGVRGDGHLLPRDAQVVVERGLRTAVVVAVHAPLAPLAAAGRRLGAAPQRRGRF